MLMCIFSSTVKIVNLDLDGNFMYFSLWLISQITFSSFVGNFFPLWIFLNFCASLGSSHRWNSLYINASFYGWCTYFGRNIQEYKVHSWATMMMNFCTIVTVESVWPTSKFWKHHSTLTYIICSVMFLEFLFRSNRLHRYYCAKV